MKSAPIDLDDIVPGSTLGADLVDAAGTLLLPGGANLSEAVIGSLRRRGIKALCVASAASDPAAVAARRALIERDLRVRFRHAGNSDATRLLFQATLEHLLEKGS
jgi:hypothetical protein